MYRWFEPKAHFQHSILGSIICNQLFLNFCRIKKYVKHFDEHNNMLKCKSKSVYRDSICID